MSGSNSSTSAERTPSLSLTLERFDYARVGDSVAVMQVLARVHDGQNAPAAAELALYAGAGAPLRFAARACRSEQRLLAGGATQTLWRALFTLPLSAVEPTGVLFELSTGAAFAQTVILPVPAARHPGPTALALIPAEALTRAGASPLRQAVAVATAVAVTASSTPVLAAAASAAPVLHAGGTAARISDQVRIAQDRLRHQRLTLRTASAARQRLAAAAAITAAANPPAPAPATPAPTAKHRAKAAPTAKPRVKSAVTTRTVTQGTRPSHRAGRHRSEGLELAPSRMAQPSTSGTARPTVSPSASAPGAVPVGSSGGVAAGNTVAPGTTVAPGNTVAPGTTIAPGTTVAPGSTVAPSNSVTAGQLPNTTPPTPAPAQGQTPPAATGTPVAQPVTTAPPRVHRAQTEPASQRPARTVTRRSSTGGAPVLGGLTKRPPTTPVGTSTPTGGAPTLSPNPAGFSGPQSWSGTVTQDPALTGALGSLSNLLANGNTPPGFLIPIYMEAGRRYGVPWEVLAAINAVESDYGRNLNTSSAGAIGWMQFEPSTWREWGVAADGHSVANPYDPRDAIFSAARYLAAAGATKDIWGAVYAYNHASWYVDMVLTRARAIATNVRPERQSVRHGVVSVYFSTYQRTHPTVRFRGGMLSNYVRLVAAANMVSAANFPYVWGGGHQQPARFAAFDCSGSVSYVIQQAGYKVPTTVSGDISSWGFPTGPGRVTIFYNSTHTFMRIGNRYFGTSGFARPGGGAGWFSTNRLPASYLAQFSEVHVPALGANSFRPHRRVRLRSGQGRSHGLSPLSATRPVLLSALSPSPAYAHPHTLSASPAFAHSQKFHF
ncbi:MAG: hypothetical protein QOF83_3853 [Solirubrobacteraceae bacterium]|nr:hypothetical protein [Solirubrobacteraceae bacterium]